MSSELDPWLTPIDRKPSRPRLLTPLVRHKLLVGISRGLSRPQAARLAGISSTLFAKWLATGEQSERNSDYRRLLDEVEQAEARTEQQLIDTVFDAAVVQKDWRAAIELLKRLFPERYGDRVKVDMSVVMDEAKRLAAEFPELEESEIVEMARELLGVR